MIYIFERVPLNISEPGSIKQCFSKLKLNSDLLNKIDEIEHHKKAFYQFFSQALTDKNFTPKLAELKQAQKYLHSTIDLLEIGVSSSYNISQNYSPFIENSGKISLGKDNVSSLFAEYIFARYTYSLGTIKLLEKKCANHISAALQNNAFNSADSDEMKEVFKIGFLRLAKMHRNKNLIWQSINKGYYELPDLMMGTLDIIYSVNEINLTNMYMYHNVMKEGAAGMKPAVRAFLMSMAKVTLSKIVSLHESKAKFTRYAEAAKLQHFVAAYRLYYYLIMATFALKENREAEKRINTGERVDKSLPQLYYENYLLSNKILELERELEEKTSAKDDGLYSDVVLGFYHSILRDKDALK